MRYAHSLGSMSSAKMDGKLKQPLDYINIVLQIIEHILSWTGPEKETQVKMPYLVVDSNKKTLAHYVAKFLTSEFAQDYRFKVEQAQPTLKSLQSICTEEPHINALNQQKASGATLLLNVFGDEYFNNTCLCMTKLLNNFVADDETPSESDYMGLLQDLDGSWGV